MKACASSRVRLLRRAKCATDSSAKRPCAGSVTAPRNRILLPRCVHFRKRQLDLRSLAIAIGENPLTEDEQGNDEQDSTNHDPGDHLATAADVDLIHALVPIVF